MKDEDSHWWSGLETVSSFDNGNTSTVGQDAEEPVGLFRPSSLLVESLISQLCKLIESDQTHQKQLYLQICKKLHQMKLIDESYAMEEFDSMRSYYQKALYQLVTVAKNSKKSPDKNAMLPKAHHQICLKKDQMVWSRYLNDYEELGFIARGGFGEVFKAQHKLDGEVYAMKKIYLRYTATSFLHSVAEVKFLAKLNHPNIVTYKAAWLEPIHSSQRHQRYFDDVADTSSDKPNSSGSSIVFESADKKDTKMDLNDNYALVKKPLCDTFGEWNSSAVSNHCQDSSDSSNSESLRAKNLLELKKEMASLESSQSNNLMAKGDENNITAARHPIAQNLPPLIVQCVYQPCGGDIQTPLLPEGFVGSKRDGQSQQQQQEQDTDSVQWACLYIQMQLCDLTLRQWLDKRNHMFETVKERDCLTLFKKIVQGVVYIHSQGVVHHDIKPSNIFVSNDLEQVQVGDFGLACSLLTHNPEVAVIPSSHAHRGQVGTKLYAAPEQLNGSCTDKSDIYSLGILLMELIQPFQTDMERSKVIGQVKSGKIPPELSESFPTSVMAITRCIYHSPRKRPTAQELLELIDEEENSSSARIIAEKDETIKRLNREALDREKEIADLKRQLSELSSNSV